MNRTKPKRPDDDRPLEGRELSQFADGQQPGILREFWAFLRYNKKWWLLPIILTLVVLGMFVFLTSSAFAPFIYTLF